MIRVNLLGAQEGAQSFEHQRQLKVAYAVLAANVVAILLVSLTIGALASRRESQMQAAKIRIKELLKVAKDVENEEQRRQLLEEKRRVIDELESRGVGPFQILEALSEATPSRLWLTEFTDRSGQVTITGLAIDDPTVADFLQRLQHSPHFVGLELVETAQAEEGNVAVKKFVMRGPLSYSGAASRTPGNGNGNGNGKSNGNGKHP